MKTRKSKIPSSYPSSIQLVLRVTWGMELIPICVEWDLLGFTVPSLTFVYSTIALQIALQVHDKNVILKLYLKLDLQHHDRYSVQNKSIDC